VVGHPLALDTQEVEHIEVRQDRVEGPRRRRPVGLGGVRDPPFEHERRELRVA
jgi:hypothetical protein